MSQLTYTNPQGSTDTFPFPTDAAKKIYYQEVNNMFEQVRVHLNSSIGVDNLELPFTSEIPWVISGGSAISITTEASAAALLVTHSVSPLVVNTGLIQMSSSTANPATSAMIRIEQTGVGAVAPYITMKSSSTAPSWGALEIQDNAAAALWKVGRVSSPNAIRQSTMVGWEHQIAVNDVVGFRVADALVTSEFALTSPLDVSSSTSLTVGNTVITDGQVELDSTPTQITGSAGNITLPQAIMRLGTTDAAVLRKSVANTLTVEQAIQLDNLADTPVQLNHTGNERLQVRKELELHNGSSAVVMSTDGTNLLVDGITVLTRRSISAVFTMGTRDQIAAAPTRINGSTLSVPLGGFTGLRGISGLGNVSVKGRATFTYDIPFSSIPAVVVSIDIGSIDGHLFTYSTHVFGSNTDGFSLDIIRNIEHGTGGLTDLTDQATINIQIIGE